MSDVRKNGEMYSSPVGNGLGLGRSAGATDSDEYVISLAGLLWALRRWLWIILLAAVLLPGVVLALNLAQPPIYEASIKILVSQERRPTDTPMPVYDLQLLTQTMADAVNTLPVAESVIRRQNLRITPEELLANLTVAQVPDTQFIQVDYTDSSPQRAQRIANAIGEVFSTQVSEMSPSANAITATVWQQATVPDDPVSPNPLRNCLLALVLGLMLGVGLALLLEYLYDSWRSPEEVEQISRVRAFGIIPKFEISEAKNGRYRVAGSRRETEPDGLDAVASRLVTVSDPTSAASEAYRTLRTNLLHAFVDEPPKVIVLSSPGLGEGKSTTCANLGVVLAQVGKNTLIVDCDFRKPVVHKFFGLQNTHGVMDVLARVRELHEVWKEPVEGLKVVPVGPVPPNPTEALDTQRLSELLANVREEFDYVLVDAAPVGLVSDATILATRADGVLLIVDSENSRKGSVRRAMHSLETVGANVLGTVMNNVKISRDAYVTRSAYE